ncbi:hypothetical protein [Reichenbachiella sp. MALMAid0571]|uniref:hypothetical protein n=1 Tax=Reichenbachiella sp. MALMAid0571 TaxID=3143939 RepID=UPI0032E02903
MQKNNHSRPGMNDNWKVVVLAIAGAATFWLFNALNKDYDTRISLPLEFVFNKDSVVVVSPLAKKVDVDVNGGGWNLLRKSFQLNSSPITIELDNPTEINYYTQSSLVPIISDQLRGFRLNYVITDTLFIDIEEKVTKKVTVVIDSLNIPLESGLRLTSPIDILQDSLILTGPKSLLAKQKPYIYGKFGNDPINANFDGEVVIDLPANGLIIPNYNKVNVKFDVGKFVMHSIVVEIEKLRFPSLAVADLSDTVVGVSFIVNENHLSNINPSDFGVTVDYTLLNKTDSTIIPTLMYYPDGIDNVQLNPEKLKVKLKRK